MKHKMKKSQYNVGDYFVNDEGCKVQVTDLFRMDGDDMVEWTISYNSNGRAVTFTTMDVFEKMLSDKGARYGGNSSFEPIIRGDEEVMESTKKMKKAIIEEGAEFNTPKGVMRINSIKRTYDDNGNCISWWLSCEYVDEPDGWGKYIEYSDSQLLDRMERGEISRIQKSIPSIHDMIAQTRANNNSLVKSRVNIRIAKTNVESVKEEIEDYFAPEFIWVKKIESKGDGATRIILTSNDEDEDLTEDMLEEVMRYVGLMITSASRNGEDWILLVE